MVGNKKLFNHLSHNVVTWDIDCDTSTVYY